MSGKVWSLSDMQIFLSDCNLPQIKKKETHKPTFNFSITVFEVVNYSLITR